jgi:hypothetical protein
MSLTRGNHFESTIDIASSAKNGVGLLELHVGLDPSGELGPSFGLGFAF